jgi:D-lyxose ketol-isomerase
VKRSDINTILEEAMAFFDAYKVILPPFAHWPVAKMQSHNTKLIAERGLGWDVTDYGKGNFDQTRLCLFTARNGILSDLKRGSGEVYAEKLMISRKDQLSPMHRHISKTEDIISRGGGTLVMQLFASTSDGSIDQNSSFSVFTDGQEIGMQVGEKLALKPGQSVTLVPGIWHGFWTEQADVLITEVSSVNDDETDNVFEEDIARFSTVQEDCTPFRLLVSDYDRYLSNA